MTVQDPPDVVFPCIRAVGLDGLMVSFGDRLSEPANRAALAFRAALEAEGWDGVRETTTSLVSAAVFFDPLDRAHDEMEARLRALLESRDWLHEALPGGRRFFRIPTIYGGEHGPQLAEAAAAAGLDEAAAIDSLSGARVRVTTIGFAPGQPYLGELSPDWDIPRQQTLTPTVPRGALVVAIRQLVLFSVTTPTGWRHVGQTAFRLFRPDSDTPFVLRPGDEVQFDPVEPGDLPDMEADPDGGAMMEEIR